MAKNSKSKGLEINVDKRVPRFAFASLVPMQGDLKSLSKDEFEKLRASIIDDGFFVPMFVWKDPKSVGRLHILDGHQRHRVLTHLRDIEGYEIPEVPAIPIEAKDQKAAARKLLQITSQYGKLDRQGLYEFLGEFELDFDIVGTDLSLPEFSLDAGKFLDEFVNETTPVETEAGTTSEEPAQGKMSSDAVRMMQLFFTEESYKASLERVEFLKEEYGVTNASDVIDRALEEVVNAIEAKRAKRSGK